MRFLVAPITFVVQLLAVIIITGWQLDAPLQLDWDWGAPLLAIALVPVVFAASIFYPVLARKQVREEEARRVPNAPR